MNTLMSAMKPLRLRNERNCQKGRSFPSVIRRDKNLD